MTSAELFEAIVRKQSFLSVGLDPDLSKLPAHLLTSPDPIFEFNKQIIDATADLCVAYKLNTAFYEANGIAGWEAFEKTIDYIPKGIFIVADAKRGDIGNTSDMYARAFFETFKADAVTVSPYMGTDSVMPFLQYPGKWAIVLGLTSNTGSADFQLVQDSASTPLYETVLINASHWGTKDNLMFVVGATHAQQFKAVRDLLPHHFFLVPGVGAQGGSLHDVSLVGLNSHCGLLVNSSRQIIYAAADKTFAAAARVAALSLQLEMSSLLKDKNLL